VNLATRGHRRSRLLDPFAGAGGIVVAGHAAGHVTFSADIDPVVAVGLQVLTEGRHVLADARALPFADASCDAIATETPFAEVADDAIAAMLPELARVLRQAGRLAVMCGDRQAALLRDRADMLRPLVDHEVDRKGLVTRVLAWERVG
jgi:tRNA G10  N-methylase Trm11